MKIKGSSSWRIIGQKTGNATPQDYWAHVDDNPFELTPEHLAHFEYCIERIVEKNMPVHLTPPNYERYPGMVALVNVRVLRTLLAAARQTLEDEPC
jgi:hypothetical protein